MRISDADLDRMLADARRATQGEWNPDSDGENIYSDVDGEEAYPRWVVNSVDEVADAINIANACPQNFIALCEEVKTLRDVMKHYGIKEW